MRRLCGIKGLDKGRSCPQSEAFFNAPSDNGGPVNAGD